MVIYLVGFPRSSFFSLVSVAFNFVDNYVCRKEISSAELHLLNLVGAGNCFVFLVTDIINFNETFGLIYIGFIPSTFSPPAFFTTTTDSRVLFLLF